MKYEFTDEYLTGIELIDTEHAHLFELANKAYDLLTDQFALDKYDRIAALLEELREYTKTHFAHEEECMESINFRHIWSEKHQHITFVNRLESIDLKAMDENQQEHLMEIIEFLALWLQGHIKGADKRIGTYYDSLPDEAKA
ncbi:MAG: hemerythrin family protein [Anaerovibrio sp.]|nr:hemerythrin family protein [Anaerovibrio sp.]